MSLFPWLCVTALGAILVVFRKLPLLFNMLAAGLFWISCSAYSQAAFVRNRSYARQLLSAPRHTSCRNMISSSLQFSIFISPVSSCYSFFQCGVKSFVMAKGTETTPSALIAFFFFFLPATIATKAQWCNSVIHIIHECNQRICARCCSESSAFCLWISETFLCITSTFLTVYTPFSVSTPLETFVMLYYFIQPSCI